MTLALRYTVRTDVGLIREGNEDSAYAGPHLLAIADGMGGHAAGEVASGVAIATLAPLDTDPADGDMLQSLADAISLANQTLRQITFSDPATEGMGTTLTAMRWSDGQLALCHIGDSRAYLLRDGVLRQITHDHTLVQSLVDEGRLTPEAAASHPHRSLVVRALQSSIPANPDLTLLTAHPGDRYLLCSDGLSDVVSDETIGKTLTDLEDLDDAVALLIDLAIRSGGPDNITCVLADVVDTGSGAVQPSEQAIIVGAMLTEDDPGTAERADSPASRAHLLIQGVDLTGEDPAAQPDPAAQSDSAGPAGDAEDSAGTADPARGDADENEVTPAAPGRRLWPIVTSSLITLLVVIGAAAYGGWRMTQNQYFVGVANGKVAVFRGVDDNVAGLNLSRMVERTGIPLTFIPRAEASQVKATISASNLDDAHKIVSRIRQDYQCGLVEADIKQWATSRSASPASPAPAKSPSGVTSQTNGGQGTSKHLVLKAAAPTSSSYPPEPVLPAYCSSSTGGPG